ncbi:uncharacterized protein LOC125833108 [Solanum verrucosum]|uniref:uncharacterized protein LOC125833108 n=1 Tax=Solanum verrucosum TaxID=315347 RepID=UPI0020D05FF9|nr:uncharacterized protein LOC125833108 [Solanum verrucosum]
MVADSRARMSKFVSDVSEMVVKECQTAMLIHDMEIFRLMVHTQQIEEEKLKEKSREVKWARTSSYNAPPKFNKDRVSNPKHQGGNGSVSSLPRPNCTKCGKKHDGKCLANTDGCFGCGKTGYKMRDCPMLVAKEREGKQATPHGLGSNDPKQNRFYAHQTRGEQEGSPNMVTEPSVVSTPAGDFIAAMRVYRKCHNSCSQVSVPK